jgi:hypothetical protein
MNAKMSRQGARLPEFGTKMAQKWALVLNSESKIIYFWYIRKK